MTIEAQKQEVMAVIAQTQDEELLRKIAELIPSLVPPKVRLPLGFARGEGFWMADDFDEPLEDFADYM